MVPLVYSDRFLELPSHVFSGPIAIMNFPWVDDLSSTYHLAIVIDRLQRSLKFGKKLTDHDGPTMTFLAQRKLTIWVPKHRISFVRVEDAFIVSVKHYRLFACSLEQREVI